MIRIGGFHSPTMSVYILKNEKEENKMNERRFKDLKRDRPYLRHKRQQAESQREQARKLRWIYKLIPILISAVEAVIKYQQLVKDRDQGWRRRRIRWYRRIV